MKSSGKVLVVIVALLVVAAVKAVQIIPQARAANVERLGRFRRTLQPGEGSRGRCLATLRRRVGTVKCR